MLVAAATCGGAQQVQILVGVWGLFPTVEATVLTPPAAWAGYHQEVGLRLTWLVFGGIFDLVLRSWWSLPQSDSDFLRQKLRWAVEYSPTLWAAGFDGGAGWLPLALRSGVGAAFRMNDPSAPSRRELLVSALTYLELSSHRYGLGNNMILPLAGIAFRWPDP